MFADSSSLARKEPSPEFDNRVEGSQQSVRVVGRHEATW
jgi:hypothetical protein